MGNIEPPSHENIYLIYLLLKVYTFTSFLKIQPYTYTSLISFLFFKHLSWLASHWATTV